MSHKTALFFCAIYILFCTFPVFGKTTSFGITTDEASDDALVKDLHDEPIGEDDFPGSEVKNHPHASTPDTRYEDNDEDNGGPSSEFRPMGYDWAMENREYLEKRGVDTECFQRKRSTVGDEITAEKLCAEEKDFFAQLPSVMKKNEKALEKALKKANLKGIVTGRIKSLGSLVGKMKQDGVDDVRKITDIVGLRVTLQTTSDIQAFKRSFLRLNDKRVAEIRCYGTCGPNVDVTDKREKKYWPWKGSGYRRLHFKVSVPSLETQAEIQVGTPYMTLWAEWEHAVVYKGPEDLKSDPQVRSYAQELAQYYMMLDNMRDGLNPRCPKTLKKTSGKDIFSPHDWETFGKPHDACNFWNDLRADMPN